MKHEEKECWDWLRCKEMVGWYNCRLTCAHCPQFSAYPRPAVVSKQLLMQRCMGGGRGGGWVQNLRKIITSSVHFWENYRWPFNPMTDGPSHTLNGLFTLCIWSPLFQQQLPSHSLQTFPDNRTEFTLSTDFSVFLRRHHCKYCRFPLNTKKLAYNLL